MTQRAPIAWITGSTRGLGRALALAQRGYAVAVHGRDAVRGTAVVEEIAAAGGTAWWVPADVRDARAMRAAADAIAARGGIDLLIAAASAYEDGPIATLAPEQWDDVLGTTLTGTFHTLQAAWPHLTRPGGRVLTFGCVGAERVYHGAHTVPYRIAVSGIYSLTKAYAQLGAPDGITVNMLALGFLEDSVTPPKPAQIPAGRASQPDDMIPVVEFLASPAAAHVNGACINVAGGFVT